LINIREKVGKRKERNRSSSLKAKYRNTRAMIVSASDLFQKIRSSPITSISKAYSNERNRENKYGHSKSE